MHPDQLTISVETVHELVENQFPDWAGLPIAEIASQGTVNALFRLGDHLAARFPLQPADADETRRWLESEAEAALELLGRTPFTTPEPVAIGDPGAGFPLPWLIQTWLPGTAATEAAQAVRFHSLRTWRRSFKACDQSIPAVARSPGRVGVETCARTMTGCKPASSAARNFSMYRGSDECGQRFVNCHESLRM